MVCRKVGSDSHNHANGTNGVDGTARVNDDPAKSIIILLVTRDTVTDNKAGSYEIIGESDLMGHTATSGPHARWTKFQVPEENVLAEGEAAAALVEQTFTATAALVGAFSVSIMKKAFELAMKFAKSDNRGRASSTQPTCRSGIS